MRALTLRSVPKKKQKNKKSPPKHKTEEQTEHEKGEERKSRENREREGKETWEREREREFSFSVWREKARKSELCNGKVTVWSSSNQGSTTATISIVSVKSPASRSTVDHHIAEDFWDKWGREIFRDWNVAVYYWLIEACRVGGRLLLSGDDMRLEIHFCVWVKRCRFGIGVGRHG